MTAGVLKKNNPPTPVPSPRLRSHPRLRHPTAIVNVVPESSKLRREEEQTPASLIAMEQSKWGNINAVYLVSVCVKSRDKKAVEKSSFHRLHVIHCTGRFLSAGLIATSGTHFIFGFGIFTGLIDGLFAGIFGNIF